MSVRTKWTAVSRSSDNTAPKLSASSICVSFDALPDSAYIREAQLVQSPKRPGSPAPLPFSAPTLWRMVRAGTFPSPAKLSKRVTAWRVADVRHWLAAHSRGMGA